MFINRERRVEEGSYKFLTSNMLKNFNFSFLSGEFLETHICKFLINTLPNATGADEQKEGGKEESREVKAYFWRHAQCK